MNGTFMSLVRYITSLYPHSHKIGNSMPKKCVGSLTSLIELINMEGTVRRFIVRHPITGSVIARVLAIPKFKQKKLQRQHFLLSYFKTLDDGPAGDELTTSRVTAQCSTN